ncbi:UNVERIFIED_ORG: spermidine/putrescine transport system permease protein [Rhizobium sp. SORGH_AS 755]|nr:spermidine/putrescine transport system permease protein [Rhizobium sp. SORGH_AS_0755]
MVNTTMTELREEGAPAPAHYSGWIGKVTGSALYRTTIGRLADSRHARLALLAGIPVIWLFALHVGPILQMANISFTDNYPPQPNEATRYTLANYALFFSDSIYVLPFIRSLVFAAVVTVSTLVIVYPVAYYVAKVLQPKQRMRALLLLLIPFWAGELIRTFSVIMLLANRGAVNVLLREIGLIDRPIPMLYTSFSLSFGVIYLLALYMLLPLYSAIEKIPVQLVHAAADLGASPFPTLPPRYPAAVERRYRVRLQPGLPHRRRRLRRSAAARRAESRHLPGGDRDAFPLFQRQMA